VTVTIDINVALDVFQRREPHYAASAQVLGLVESGAIGGVFPAHALTTLYYLVRKHATRAGAEAAMARVLAHFEIGNLDAAGWRAAGRLGFSDFEDAAVALVAERTGSAFIVTRNVADFAGASRPAIAPADFLSLHPMAGKTRDGRGGPQ
jgi:predicted nucleic acid-binding protein